MNYKIEMVMGQTDDKKIQLKLHYNTMEGEKVITVTDAAAEVAEERSFI